jgi:hypothetical protein
MAALKAAFQKKSEKPSDGENTGFWDKFWPFFKMEMDTASKFRFLPDADDQNPLGFIVQNTYHELIVNGKKKRVACGKMYGESCACCEKSQEYYSSGDTAMGKKFWKKIDYIAQGIVKHSSFPYPIKDDENPVRLIQLGPKIYKVIESKIIKGDMDYMPYDLKNGYDFDIFKTKQGEYADYTTSDFGRRSTGIDPEIEARIELYDLKKFRYVKIEREQMEAIIEAALTGAAYAESEPAPEQSTGSPALDQKLAETKPTQSVQATVVAASTPPVAETPPAAPAKLSPQEILRKLKERTAQASAV